MKKYFLYELKKNVYPLCAIAFIMTVAYILPLAVSEYPEEYILLLPIYVGITAIAVPVWLNFYKMKKRSIDLYYSLPVSRRKIISVRYLIGLIAVFAPYTLAFWLGALVVACKMTTVYPVWFVPYYFLSLIPVYILYSFSAFAFTRANSFIDGIVFIVFLMFAVTMIVFTFRNLATRKAWDNYECFYLMPYDPLVSVTSFFREMIDYNKSDFFIRKEDLVQEYRIAGFVINCTLSGGATFYLLFGEKYSKAERVGQISESLFGYKVMIPFYTVCLLSMCCLKPNYYSYYSNFETSLVFEMLAVIIGAFMLTVLYRRTVKIGKKQALILGISIAAGIILMLINCLVAMN